MSRPRLRTACRRRDSSCSRITIARGFVFYTNVESRKGEEIAANPRVALCFHWKSLLRQVRIEGRAEFVTDAEADAYFASRARGAQIGAWASAQSRPYGERAELEKLDREADARFAGAPVPRPPYWTGYRVVPALFRVLGGSSVSSP